MNLKNGIAIGVAHAGCLWFKSMCARRLFVAPLEGGICWPLYPGPGLCHRAGPGALTRAGAGLPQFGRSQPVSVFDIILILQIFLQVALWLVSKPLRCHGTSRLFKLWLLLVGSHSWDRAGALRVDLYYKHSSRCCAQLCTDTTFTLLPFGRWICIPMWKKQHLCLTVISFRFVRVFSFPCCLSL